VGTPNTKGFGQTIAGTLEMSNVDMATEFTNMIQAERGYQANSSVISTADQMLQTLVQLRS
jgi:flagellar hook protein FlgE